jgi:DUF4097 and DUF4098 domain-containing protein YvlB
MWPLLLSLNATAAEYVHAAKPDVHFSIDLWCGSVSFRAGKDPNVRVTGEFGGLTPMFEGTDKELRFVLPVSENAAMFRSHDGCDVQLDISVPETASIDANSTKGDIRVNGIHGVLVLEAIMGDITVLDPGREVRATAVNGDIHVNDLRGEAELATVNGDITLDAPDLQELRSQTVNGDTQIRGKKVRRLQSQTVQGDIVFGGTLDPTARLDFESHAGDISLRVPPDPGFVLALQSFSGQIENGVSSASAAQPDFGPGTHLDTTVGSGAARIEAQTFSGDIVIEPPGK